MHNLLPVMDGDNISVNYADRICTTLEMYIDSLQEEPVSEGLEEAADNCYFHNHAYARESFIEGANWQKEHIIANTTDAMIGLPYENKDGGYTHLIDVSRPLPVGNNKIAIIFKED